MCPPSSRREGEGALSGSFFSERGHAEGACHHVQGAFSLTSSLARVARSVGVKLFAGSPTRSGNKGRLESVLK
jgi:hypothetical protein